METVEITPEQQQIEELGRQVRRLQALTDALCSTNFLTEHQDGDEEVRKWAVAHVNNHNRKVVDNYKVKMEHNRLWMEQRNIRDRMMLLEQDYPELIKGEIFGL